MKLTAETATLADAVNRAARVAPTKGAAFHQAAGVLFELRPSGADQLVIRATDLDVTYRQRVAVLDIDPDEGDWRIPAQLLAGILNTLPMGEGSTVTLQSASADLLKIRSGKAKAELRLIANTGNDEFPRFGSFDGSTMTHVDNFAQRVAQVAWASDPKSAPLSGVHIDGKRLVATDRNKIAVVPCDVPIDTPITVPLAPLNGVLKNTASVALRATDKRLLLMPDEDTQVTTIIYAQEYPGFDRVLRDNFAGESTIDRAALEGAIGRMLVLVRGEKFPLVRLTFSDKAVGVLMDVPEVGLMEDEVEALGGPDEPFEIWFTPQNLTDALNGTTSANITVAYGPDAKMTLRITDDDGYRCDVMPRHVVNGQKQSAAAA